MSDLINRQDAIEALWGINSCEERLFVDAVVDMLENLPDAESERKTGKWVPVTNRRGGFECNQCHNYAPSYQNGNEYLSYFCPHCGAEMINEDSYIKLEGVEHE